MRLWSLHPRYLDRTGLIALWREALLAQAVLRGATRGYRNHPQLDRFRDQAAPLARISWYLHHVHLEAKARGYTFDESKIEPDQPPVALTVTTGQLAYEWQHLLAKLTTRDPVLYQQWLTVEHPEPHPIFEERPGAVEPWERQ